ncbi:hypothetical protein ACH4E8_29420 [Streptomyces sp. NPDC017979]|uniref:hypothetical protein n=1 Tax=Streptomyces sp. NPDC017979 TaxID=3365024 RepID=UPI00379B7405
MTARKTESWDSFKKEVFGDRTEVIEGVRVQVPTDVPFGFQERLADLSESSEREDVAELVDALFGPDVLDQWEAAGIGTIGLMTVLTWGMAQGSGQRDFTFRDAYEALTSDDPGKAPAQPANRAARRAAQKKPSTAGGGRSKRTSSGSTGSGRATSSA